MADVPSGRKYLDSSKGELLKDYSAPYTKTSLITMQNSSKKFVCLWNNLIICWDWSCHSQMVKTQTLEDQCHPKKSFYVNESSAFYKNRTM